MERAPTPGQAQASNRLGNPFRGDRVPETGQQESHIRMWKNWKDSAQPPSTKQHGGHVHVLAKLGSGGGGVSFLHYSGVSSPKRVTEV